MTVPTTPQLEELEEAYWAIIDRVAYHEEQAKAAATDIDVAFHQAAARGYTSAAGMLFKELDPLAQEEER